MRSSALNTFDCLIRFVVDVDVFVFFFLGMVFGLIKVLVVVSGVCLNVGVGLGGIGVDGVEFVLSSMVFILSCVLNDLLYELEFGDFVEGEGVNVL